MSVKAIQPQFNNQDESDDPEPQRYGITASHKL